MEYETDSWMNPYYNPDTPETSDYDPGVNQDLPYNETGLQFSNGSDFIFKTMVFMLITCSVVCGCMRGFHIEIGNLSRRNNERYRTSITSRESDLATYLIEHTQPGSGDEENINDSEDDDTCVICIEQFSGRSTNIMLDCGHKFHSACIISWFKKELTCPICRKSVFPN